MCDVCFRFVELGRALCVRCAYELRTRAQRRISLSVFMGLFSIAVLIWGSKQVRFDIEPWLFWVGAGLGLLVAGYLARAGFQSLQEDRVEARSSLAVNPQIILPSPRQRRAALARRVVQAASPKLSGSATALIVLLALLCASLTFPFAMHGPRWVEIEAVLAATWCILFLSISVLLFRGFRLHDDLFFYAPRFDLARRPGQSDLRLDGCDLADPGCVDASSCDEGVGLLVAVLAALAIVVLATLLSWLVVEAILPLAFLAFYAVLMAALKRAARDRHDCKGQLGRALGWGMAWAPARRRKVRPPGRRALLVQGRRTSPRAIDTGREPFFALLEQVDARPQGR